ncbi:hypothetical protein AXF42_Ash008017 [Apostasia shenzhenica]|uniref:Uncharacterized protein n=1 Tax=Apostasia shenzhenica TaxID=1088818 RepID=A0A2I0A8C1_9ASPA|nr:hypothetical protein AXF42_Ash008017 [Apostasia shenzhenica]
MAHRLLLSIADLHRRHLHEKAQNESAARLVEELAETLAICDEMVGEEEEASSKYLIAKAVECSLRLLMLENEWKCVGENTFVQSNFSVDEQRNHHQALNVRVQSEKDDDLVFLVSPDVIWFTRHKISDLVSSRSLQSFQQGNLAVVEEDSFLTACTTLPSFHVGHIIGLSKIPPLGEKLEMLEELWMLKHGLALSSEYYINVHFNCGGYTSKQWFPSGFVLRGSEFSPAPKSMRSSMAKVALESFMKIIGGWDFFNQGLLKVKEVSSLNAPIMQPVWKAVGAANEGNNKTFGSMYSTIDEYISFQNLQLTLDFRTPKPALGLASGSKISDHDGNNSAAVCKGERITDATVQCTLRPETLNATNNIVKLAAKHLPVSQTQTYQKGDVLLTFHIIKYIL